MARLEPLFDQAQLTHTDASAPVMAVVDEYPCRDVRGGGVANMGTYFIKRDAETLAILEEWYASEHHGGASGAQWPARQGAFSHDLRVYEAHKGRISAFPPGCVAGSPFAPLIGHGLGGIINGAYDPDVAREAISYQIRGCVMDALHAKKPGATCTLSSGEEAERA